MLPQRCLIPGHGYHLRTDRPSRGPRYLEPRAGRDPKDGTRDWAHERREYENSRKGGGEKEVAYGPVVLATGGYEAYFTAHSSLKKHRPQYYNLPTTNADHCTGDGFFRECPLTIHLLIAACDARQRQRHRHQGRAAAPHWPR